MAADLPYPLPRAAREGQAPIVDRPCDWFPVTGWRSVLLHIELRQRSDPLFARLPDAASS